MPPLQSISGLVLILSCAICGSSQRVVLQTIIDDSSTLVLREGDNPCKILHDMCCDDHEETDAYGACVDAAYPLMTRQLTATWRHLSRRLNVDAGIFLECNEIYDGSSLNTSLVGRDDIRQTFQGLLDILREGSGEAAAREFDVRRNDQRMTEEEQLELYRQAILLEPNHPLIVGQFGVSLLATGREKLARALFSDAVRRSVWESAMQRPVNYYVPGLSSKPWYDPQDFAFTEIIERGYEDMRRELTQVMMRDLFYVEAENRNSFDTKGSWKTLIISERHSYTQLAKTHFPKTIDWLKKCREDFLLVKFSALESGTHIISHTGPSNERLRSHLTVIHSGGARLRVGEEWRTWEEGRVLVFDSSYEHEVVHDGPDRRVVLILDVWHPDYINDYNDGH